MVDLYDMPAPGQVPDTSARAGKKIETLLRGLRGDIYKLIAASGAHGATTSELAEILENYRTVQPRTSELKSWGLIYDNGVRRENQYGNPEIVWQSFRGNEDDG